MHAAKATILPLPASRNSYIWEYEQVRTKTTTYSTVTDFAKLRGWSTSWPRKSAM